MNTQRNLGYLINRSSRNTSVCCCCTFSLQGLLQGSPVSPRFVLWSPFGWCPGRSVPRATGLRPHSLHLVLYLSPTVPRWSWRPESSWFHPDSVGLSCTPDVYLIHTWPTASVSPSGSCGGGIVTSLVPLEVLYLHVPLIRKKGDDSVPVTPMVPTDLR